MKALLVGAAALMLSVSARAELKIQEIRTAADNVIELFWVSDKLDVNEVYMESERQGGSRREPGSRSG